MTYWYISFATDRGFRGATVVEANDAKKALKAANRRGLNPGGEAAILEVPKEAEKAADFQAMINRLVGRDEMIARGGMRQGDLPVEVQAHFEEVAAFICQDCNERQTRG